MPSTSRRVALFAAVVFAGLSLVPADALVPAPSTGTLPERARSDEVPSPVARAVRVVAEPVDMVSVYQASFVSPSVVDRARAAARAAGGRSVVGLSAAIQMTRLRRGSVSVQEPPAGWRIPFGTTILPTSAVEAVMGPLVASGIGEPRNVVIAQTTADMRGARQGDRMEVRTSGGGTIVLAISLIVPDAMIGGTELVMNLDDAAAIGIKDPSRVLIWGFDSRSRIMAELSKRDLVDSSRTGVLGSSTTRVRVRRSWDAMDPDLNLGVMETKDALGEFAFIVYNSGGVSISQSWIDERMDCGPSGGCRRVLNPSIPIKARCHADVLPALQGALAEVAAAGLSWTIDVGNANSYGGCFYPRFNRLSTSPYVGFLSRHTWGMALDTNTTTNPQGGTPHMDCRTVRIFRKWGFAWGGNFLTPDGMHFEWVGEPRDQLPYPSKYCPNEVDGSGRPPLTEADTMRPRFFGGDGLVVESHDG